MRKNMLLGLLCFAAGSLVAQPQTLWHGIERQLHYKPVGNDFVKESGTRKFNRALYGTNTAFRVEAGDLPEFAMYMPGMGGNLKLGFVIAGKSKWLTEADSIVSIYRPGAMLYEVRDKLLGNAVLKLYVLALADAEGMIIGATATPANNNVEWIWAYGGATGKKFSRDGDIGADPESSFYLKPEYCADNIFTLRNNAFSLMYGFTKPLSEEERYEVQHLPTKESSVKQADAAKKIVGMFSANAQLKISDAHQQQNPLQLWNANANAKTPVLVGKCAGNNKEPLYFIIKKSDADTAANTNLAKVFEKAEAARLQLANRVVVKTPDAYINTIGAALSMAADAIYEDPSYMHGAVAWRMRLPAWRGAYVADVLGWHDRARSHFSSYAKSQVLSPLTAPVVSDTALHLARQKEVMGTSMFSSGYIARNPGGDLRPHHYDMNLVFVDQLLNHFNWTGDTAYVRAMWPLLERHLAWEKRNYDADGDGLYDAYACIWASDALQYSGGGVTHSSAYNYRSNKTAAALATIIGKDGTPYKKEAEKIYAAMQSKLWMQEQGSYAEFRDLLGNQLLHTSPGLWTIYHAVDENAADAFQQYQMMRYVGAHIPRIPIKAKGLPEGKWHTLSTSNWQPYTWSVNNVALGELLHTSLAYWQAGESEEAFTLWKSSLLESMCMGASPGGFQQLSFYDAVRGELYRDFADPVGMAGRSLVEGLFGIQPDLLNEKLKIQPGFPADWKHAELSTPDITLKYKQLGQKELYEIESKFNVSANLQLVLKCRNYLVKEVKVDGKPVSWTYDSNAIGYPAIVIAAGKKKQYKIELTWSAEKVEQASFKQRYVEGDAISIKNGTAIVKNIYDPQGVVKATTAKDGSKELVGLPGTGQKVFFIQWQQGNCSWWQPVVYNAVPAIELIPRLTNADVNGWIIRNNSQQVVHGKWSMNTAKGETNFETNGSFSVSFSPEGLMTGSNQFVLQLNDGRSYKSIATNWYGKMEVTQYDALDISAVFNDKINQVFQHQYLSPRPASTTLQLPWQGIGNWCYPLAMADINDKGLRASAVNNKVWLQKIPFATPADSLQKNIAWVSQWDNFPRQVQLELKGSAKHLYLLMAGTTNHMQSRMENGRVVVQYKDGSADTLSLKNPENWWPIEQDYMEDGFAFTTNAAKPYRLILKTGEVTRSFDKYSSIKGLTNKAIDGGAATFLDLPLDPKKELSSLTVTAVANDVVIGLMSATLVR
ncbi:MAG TPA: DUF4450 domain-containing protein [Phnomibacter sp.]|nr:DUF4450 domain-containing protein [Phnomibacter sp.]